MAKSVFSVLFFILALLGAILYFTPVYPNAKQAMMLYNALGTSIAGNPDGEITIVEFFDYRCPYCQREESVLERLLKTHPNIRLIHKAYTVFGEASVAPIKAALAANLQGKQAYLTLHHYLFYSPKYLDDVQLITLAKAAHLDIAPWQRARNSEAIARVLAENNQLAKTLDINGTPTFFFAQTALLKHLDHIKSFPQKRYRGFMTLAALENAIRDISP